jgi:hypothetical protein
VAQPPPDRDPDLEGEKADSGPILKLVEMAHLLLDTPKIGVSGTQIGPKRGPFWGHPGDLSRSPSGDLLWG